MSETKVGLIKFYKEDRGFGFIKTAEKEDFFFHITDVVDQNYLPKPDDKVRFVLVTGKRGIKAGFVEPC